MICDLCGQEIQAGKTLCCACGRKYCLKCAKTLFYKYE